MKISEVIIHLEKLKEKHGDINVCISEFDDYWGTIYSNANEQHIVLDEHAQPGGPKSGKSERAIVFSHR